MVSNSTAPRRWAVVAFTALALCGLAGCGPKGPKTYTVRGTVVFKDGDIKHLAGGRVEFQPVDDPSLIASGEIEEDGTFAPVTFKDGEEYPGLVAGTHRASVRPPGDTGDEERDQILIDRRFQSFARSGLRYTIPEDREILVEVTRPGK